MPQGETTVQIKLMDSLEVKSALLAEAERTAKAEAVLARVLPVLRHVAGLVAPEAGEEYGLIHREVIYEARRALDVTTD